MPAFVVSADQTSQLSRERRVQQSLPAAKRPAARIPCSGCYTVTSRQNPLLRLRAVGDNCAMQTEPAKARSAQTLTAAASSSASESRPCPILN
jgi:hypothetical protein